MNEMFNGIFDIHHQKCKNCSDDHKIVHYILFSVIWWLSCWRQYYQDSEEQR